MIEDGPVNPFGLGVINQPPGECTEIIIMSDIRSLPRAKIALQHTRHVRVKERRSHAVAGKEDRTCSVLPDPF